MFRSSHPQGPKAPRPQPFWRPPEIPAVYKEPLPGDMFHDGVSTMRFKCSYDGLVMICYTLF